LLFYPVRKGAPLFAFQLPATQRGRGHQNGKKTFATIAGGKKGEPHYPKKRGRKTGWGGPTNGRKGFALRGEAGGGGQGGAEVSGAEKRESMNGMGGV